MVAYFAFFVKNTKFEASKHECFYNNIAKFAHKVLSLLLNIVQKKSKN